MLVVQEPRWRAYLLWWIAAFFVLPALASPSMGVLIGSVGTAAVVSFIQSRRQRASLVIEDDHIVVNNRFSTIRLARQGATARIDHTRALAEADDEDLDQQMRFGKLMLIVPGDREAEPIPIDAVQGLMRRDFERVYAELRAVLSG